MATVTQDRETASLIGSDKVEGTAVYGADEQRIGTIQRVMIDKVSGKVAYAVTSFGGFLGIGEDYYPLPWPTLNMIRASADIARASPLTACVAHPSTIAPMTGIGMIAPAIDKCTITTKSRFGIESVVG
jgi:PRC-barrel domain protein